MAAVTRVDVFTHAGRGGNPCPVVADATGLDADARDFEARQFPRSSGYREDAATGIAAAALAFGLLHDGLVAADDRPIRVFQGRAMGRLSEIGVRLGFAGGRAIGCLLAGEVALSGDA